jgi:hypothetical protein
MTSCSICGLPVLELDGQFECLQPYFTEDFDHPAVKLAGECHSTCLVRSEHGRTWTEWRVRHFSTGRGYRLVGEQGGWSVLVHPRLRGLLAFNVDGSSVGGERPGKHAGMVVGAGRVVEGGVLVPFDEEFNIAYHDVAVIDELKTQLAGEGKYPISRMLEALGIAGLVRWPQALEGARFVFDKRLEREWKGTRTGVGMRARYATFLPNPVVSFWKELSSLPMPNP